MRQNSDQIGLFRLLFLLELPMTIIMIVLIVKTRDTLSYIQLGFLCIDYQAQFCITDDDDNKDLFQLQCILLGNLWLIEKPDYRQFQKHKIRVSIIFKSLMSSCLLVFTFYPRNQLQLIIPCQILVLINIYTCLKWIMKLKFEIQDIFIVISTLIYSNSALFLLEVVANYSNWIYFIFLFTSSWLFYQMQRNYRGGIYYFLYIYCRNLACSLPFFFQVPFSTLYNQKKNLKKYKINVICTQKSLEVLQTVQIFIRLILFMIFIILLSNGFISLTNENVKATLIISVLSAIITIIQMWHNFLSKEYLFILNPKQLQYYNKLSATNQKQFAKIQTVGILYENTQETSKEVNTSLLVSFSQAGILFKQNESDKYRKLNENNEVEVKLQLPFTRDMLADIMKINRILPDVIILDQQLDELEIIYFLKQFTLDRIIQLKTKNMPAYLSSNQKIYFNFFKYVVNYQRIIFKKYIQDSQIMKGDIIFYDLFD